MSYEIEEGTGSGTSIRSSRVVDIFETSIENVPVGYEPITTKGGASGIATIRSGRQHQPEPRQRQNTNITFRDAIRRALMEAQLRAGQMVEAATKLGAIDVANAGFHLNDTLNDLWKWRKVREDDWGDLLNALQTALAGEDFEKFTEPQCKAIYKVITENLSMGSVDEDDIVVAVRVLREAGFDPFKAISGKEVIEEDDEE